MNEIVRVLVFKPNENSILLTFTKDEKLLKEAITQEQIQRDEKKQEYSYIFNMAKEHNMIDKDMTYEVWLDEKFPIKNDIASLYDGIISDKIKSVMECEGFDAPALYTSKINGNRIITLIDETSAINKKDKPNRGYFGTIVVAAYKSDGFITNITDEDIKIVMEHFNI